MLGEVLPGWVPIHQAHTKHGLKMTEAINGDWHRGAEVWVQHHLHSLYV